MANTSQSILRNYERAIALIILQCIRELPISFGVRRIISVLLGSHAQFILDHELYRGNMFGAFGSWKTSSLNKIIEQLIDHELLRVEMVSAAENLPTLILTDKGERFLAGQQDIELGFAVENHQELVQEFLIDMDLDHEESRLYEELRQVRYEIASARQLPPYTICHNKVLRQLARKQPQTDNELHLIPGIGDRFVEKFGTRFIDVIKDFNQNRSNISVVEPDASSITYHENLRKIKDIHPRAYEPWCDDEDDKLRQMIESGQSIKEIASYLQRQDGGIRSRIKKLGLVIR